jgi:hypothetical protein
MGIVIKTFFIIADLLIFWVILLTEISILFAYIAFPIISGALLFIR